MTPIPAGWKLVEALRESLLWTASSLAAVGKEQDVITLEGRKRTIGEILDEANAALDAPSPASVAPEDAQDERQAFEAWAKQRGYQSDELARCKLGIVSPEYFNLNTESAWKAWQARASVAAPAAGDARADRNAAFEAVRKRLCALHRYSFRIGDHGGVKRVKDRSGGWIDFDAAHELFDPVAVDAALAAQVPHQDKGDA